MKRGGTVRGFTLIELLAVLVLASLSVSLGAAQLSVFSDRARCDEMASQVRDFFERAQLLARAEGSIWVSWDERENALRGTRLEDGVETMRLDVGESCRLEVRIGASDAPRAFRADGERILVDRDGRSEDASVRVESISDPLIVRIVKIDGSSGIVSVVSKRGSP